VQATVQAALGPLPLDTILAKEGPDSPKIEYAEAILTTSVLAILVSGTFGVLGIHFLAPKCLAVGSDPSPGTAERKRWLAELAVQAQHEHAEAGLSSGTDMRVRVETPSSLQLSMRRAASGVAMRAERGDDSRSDEQWLRVVTAQPSVQAAPPAAHENEIR
jgi:hypothetical protein